MSVEDLANAGVGLHRNIFRWFAPYVLLVMVGMPQGEVLALQWDELDEKTQTLFVQWQV